MKKKPHQDPRIFHPQEVYFKYEDSDKLKSKGGRRAYNVNTYYKKTKALFNVRQLDFIIRKVIRDKETLLSGQDILP